MYASNPKRQIRRQARMTLAQRRFSAADKRSASCKAENVGPDAPGGGNLHRGLRERPGGGEPRRAFEKKGQPAQGQTPAGSRRGDRRLKPDAQGKGMGGASFGSLQRRSRKSGQFSQALVGHAKQTSNLSSFDNPHPITGWNRAAPPHLTCGLVPATSIRSEICNAGPSINHISN